MAEIGDPVRRRVLIPQTVPAEPASPKRNAPVERPAEAEPQKENEPA